MSWKHMTSGDPTRHFPDLSALVKLVAWPSCCCPCFRAPCESLGSSLLPLSTYSDLVTSGCPAIISTSCLRFLSNWGLVLHSGATTDLYRDTLGTVLLLLMTPADDALTILGVFYSVSSEGTSACNLETDCESGSFAKLGEHIWSAKSRQWQNALKIPSKNCMKESIINHLS